MDLPRLGISSVLAAALAVGLAGAFAHHARATVDAGPTAATLEEGFSMLLGAGVGLAVGSGVAAAFARRGSRWLAGLCAGVIAYVAVLVPLLVLTRPSDVGFGETIGFALFLALPLAGFVLMGAAVGSWLGHTLVRARG